MFIYCIFFIGDDKLIGLIISGLGHFDSGLRASLKLIAGETNNIEFVDFEETDSFEFIVNEETESEDGI